MHISMMKGEELLWHDLLFDFLCHVHDQPRLSGECHGNAVRIQ